jgi:hypothetical protein
LAPILATGAMTAYFGHHKAASRWATLILGDLAASLGLRTLTVYTPVEWDGYPDLGGLVADRSPDLLIYPNARQVDADSLGPLRGFHMIRDPRDIIVSGYFSHRYSHPEVFPKASRFGTELPPHRAELAALDIDAGLSREIEFSGQFIDAMATWNYAQPHIFEVRMEDVIEDPLAHWTAIVAHLGWPRPPSDPAFLAKVLERHSFRRLAGGRDRGDLDITHHYRRGVAGDWRNYLTSDHLAQIRRRYDDLVERLGYQW